MATATQRASKLPFGTLVRNYPNVTSVLMVKRLIGGAVDDTKAPPAQQWLGGARGDAGTVRMSRALNYSGVPIPAHEARLRTVKGADHLNYAFAVQEFHAWMVQRFGQPDTRVAGKPVSRDKFAGHKGIIIFDIKSGLNDDGVTRALGHADLWDGTTFFDEIYGISTPARDFFSMADAVSLWLAQGNAMLPVS